MKEINDTETLEEIKEEKEKSDLKRVLNQKKLDKFELDKLMAEA